MPDISMCRHQTCPLRGKCYRWRAVPNPFRQSYSGFQPKMRDDNCQGCDHFVPLWPGDLVRVVRRIESFDGVTLDLGEAIRLPRADEGSG